MQLHASAALLVALAVLCGCATSSATLRGLAEDQRDDVVTRPRTVEEARALQLRTAERADKVHALLDKQAVESAADHFYAALVLVQCTRESDLALAHEQALVAAELGEARGLRVAAEACDKLLVKRGMLQRYGTQFVWEPVLSAWRLYPMDPSTTDAERLALGVPALADLQKQAEALNRKPKGAPKTD
jgi:hypothetical protein